MVRFGYRDLYYSDRWQVIAERYYAEDSTGTSRTTQTVSNVFSPGYVDELVQRSRGTVNESFDEFTQEWAVIGSTSDTLYLQQDANFNVTSVTDTGGTVKERYLYDPYGRQTYLTGTWGSRSSSSYGMVYLHQGGRYNAVNKLTGKRDRSNKCGRGERKGRCVHPFRVVLHAPRRSGADGWATLLAAGGLAARYRLLPAANVHRWVKYVAPPVIGSRSALAQHARKCRKC